MLWVTSCSTRTNPVLHGVFYHGSATSARTRDSFSHAATGCEFKKTTESLDLLQCSIVHLQNEENPVRQHDLDVVDLQPVRHIAKVYQSHC